MSDGSTLGLDSPVQLHSDRSVPEWDVNPISRTAFYCCGARAEDAASAEPICGDVHAASFLAGQGEDVFAEFADEVRPNQTNVARHRIIDDIVREELTRDPERWVLVLGAGFDSRPYRLTGGRWVEVEEPPILGLKEERLPSKGCPNELHRIAVTFGKGELPGKLAALPISNPLVIVEGVFMYLSKAETGQLFEFLNGRYPEHRLVGDVMTRSFFDRYSRSLHEKLGDLGAQFREMDDRPIALFGKSGYRLRERVSIVAHGAALRGGNVASFLIRVFAPGLAYGYAIYTFDSAGSPERPNSKSP